MDLMGLENIKRHLTLSQQFDSACQRYSNRDAFSHLGVSISYSDWHEKTLTLSHWLSLQNLSPGDTVGIVLPNILQFPIIAQAVFREGLILVPINPLAKSEDLELIFRQTHLKLVFFLDLFEFCMKPLFDQFGGTMWVRCNLGDFKQSGKRLSIDSWKRYFTRYTSQSVSFNAFSFREILNNTERPITDSPHLDPVAQSIDSADTALVVYTQGTTGQIKGVCLSHQNILANTGQIQQWLESQSTTMVFETFQVVAPMSLFYSYGFVTHCILMPEIGMHSILIADPLDSKRLINTLKHYQPEIMVSMTGILKKLMADKLFKTVDLRCLKITLTAGSRVNQRVSDNWLRCTGCKITDAYGLTEATAAVTIVNLNNAPSGTVGKPVSGCQVKIMRSDSVTALAGEVGEIQIKGPQVFSRYLASPDQSAMALDECWLKTGDLGYMNDDGWLFLVDRKKDVLHQSGYRVYPNEIEQVVNRYPGISCCAAIGIPIVSAEEHIVLLIVSSDPELSLLELLRYCRSNLASYKVPKTIEIREDLPTSSMGLVKKNQLKKELMEKLKL